MSPRGQALQLVLAAGLTGLAAPALAADQPAPLPPMPAGSQVMPVGQAGPERAAWEEARADWLAECRQRFDGTGKLTGGVVGGLVGGVAGSAIAGRGNRTLGAVVGGVAGAVAGAAIGDSSDRRRAGDYCESYLDRYMASYSSGYGSNGYGHPFGQMTYGYAMQPMMVLVPVAMTSVAAPVAPQENCTETEVIEEWVPAARPAKRYIPRRSLPDKRLPLK
ncbi:glycine zipper 2TM domain-containing protein [Novosphingobium ginsenosidimutans]|uniref:17 kDa surface antigen n=1 Tax=Novosphingobium ginsenosidimutans TaxID=1176536 RepID=A0A5B8S3P8_9SPHN|nr:glycine zipper 2TM domain-containing protein [Novosphingobium ginsenosidimutans]QEA15764.1 glycine zipper 2TM domain-containing protein [Novosphingobium ginsenosidimutans]